MATLLLTRAEVEALLDPAALAPALRDALRAYSAPGAPRAERVRATLPGPGTATVLFPGVVAGIPAYSVKVHAKFPAEDLIVAGQRYYAVGGPLSLERDSQSHLNTTWGRGEG